MKKKINLSFCCLIIMLLEGFKVDLNEYSLVGD